MCRFLAYKGKPALVADFVTHPANSLIKQSFDSKERSEPLNGDGFGLGWYSPEIDNTPGLFTSLTPAWANKNLKRLAARLVSPCFFAHVRAATENLVVSDENCHPFKFGNLLWMHNGSVKDFRKIKRKLRNSLRDDIYDWILGTTDSEHAFAVFLNQFPPGKSEFSAEELKEGIRKTITELNAWSEEAGIEGVSVYNFVISDGFKVVASRYVSKINGVNATLYYTSGSDYKCEDGLCKIKHSGKGYAANLIASEPLTERTDWKEVPLNHFVVVDEGCTVSLEEI